MLGSDPKLERRVKKLEKQMAGEKEDLDKLKADVDAHNAADAQFQTDVNSKVSDLEAAVAAQDMTAIDAAIAALKESVAAQPVLTLPA